MRRLPFERHIFTVTAAGVLIRHEANDDFHVNLSDGKRSMIPRGAETRS